jgi:dihydroorotate dehydrogenase (fumarate)
MNLMTRYLGLELKNPLVPSASPLSRNLDTARRLEDAGASALVMYSLFEEEIEDDEDMYDRALHQDIGHGEASSYLPVDYGADSHLDLYLTHLAKLKDALDIPVIASLNGNTPGGWIEHAMQIQQMGADALELNVYHVPANINESGHEVEQRYIDLLVELKKNIRIPVGMKLSSQFSSPGNMVKRLDEAGVDGVALFNRFYQPDIDLETLFVGHTLKLSRSEDSLLAMRWIAILFNKVNCSLAATGGVHSVDDVIKMLLAGADVCHMTAALLKQGPEYIQTVLKEMSEWMMANEYESVDQLKGSVSQKHAVQSVAYERANYISLLQNYK